MNLNSKLLFLQVFESLKNCFRFDLKSRKWIGIKKKNQPKDLRSHAAIVYKGNMYIFGGRFWAKGKDCNCLWRFNFKKKEWRRLYGGTQLTFGFGPEIQKTASLWADGKQLRFLFFSNSIQLIQTLFSQEARDFNFECFLFYRR